MSYDQVFSKTAVTAPSGKQVTSRESDHPAANDRAELMKRHGELKTALAEIFKMPDHALQGLASYPVQPTKDALAWETVTAQCCLGGCDMDIYTFLTEREALMFSALLNVIGYRSPHNIACHACYEEYIRERI